jgi:hypothetical protein
MFAQSAPLVAQRPMLVQVVPAGQLGLFGPPQEGAPFSPPAPRQSWRGLQ